MDERKQGIETFNAAKIYWKDADPDLPEWKEARTKVFEALAQREREHLARRLETRAPKVLIRT